MLRDQSLLQRALGVLPRRPAVSLLPVSLLAVSLLIASISVSVGGADESPPGGLPQLIEFARDGTALEEVLDGAGFGAAWRAATGLGDIARALSVTYPDDTAEPATTLVATLIELDNVILAHDNVVHDLRAVADELAVAIEDERQALIVRNRADAHHRGVVALLRAVALQLFEGAYGADDYFLGLDGEGQMTAFRNIEITSHTLEEMIARRRAAETALAEAEAALADAIETTRALTDEHRRLDEEATTLARARARLDETVRTVIPEAADSFALATTTNEAGLTPRALDAYIRAERATSTAQPYCGITWRTIAAIAAVESRHGTYDGRTLDMNGRSDRPIVGLRLDGNGVDNYGSPLASIPDTDQGRWDGDTLYDRAIGPLQFIPQSWQRWARDGDDDGETDPYDIDDASLATAAYLCSYGSHRSWENWNTAVFGYNHSVDYVASVKAVFDRIQRIRLPASMEDPRLQPSRPYGTYVELPDPEETEDPGETP